VGQKGKLKKKKTRIGNIKKFPTPHQFIIKTNDKKTMSWKNQAYL
jgi:hypothetical protein